MIDVCANQKDGRLESLGRSADLVHPVLNRCDRLVALHRIEDHQIDAPRCEEELVCRVENFLTAKIEGLKDDIGSFFNPASLLFALLKCCLGRQGKELRTNSYAGLSN